MSKKGDEWKRFAEIVLGHIESYSIIQYDDYGSPDELLGKMTADDCMEHINQYVKRYGKNVRGPVEAARDLLKISHFAGVAYLRMMAERDGWGKD